MQCALDSAQDLMDFNCDVRYKKKVYDTLQIRLADVHLSGHLIFFYIVI